MNNKFVEIVDNVDNVVDIICLQIEIGKNMAKKHHNQKFRKIRYVNKKINRFCSHKL